MRASFFLLFDGIFLRFMVKGFEGNWLIYCRDEKRNLRFPCIQWKRERNFVPVSTVYKGNANFGFSTLIYWEIIVDFLGEKISNEELII
jgi:hypothetical protein